MVVRLRKLLTYPCEGLPSLPEAANSILIAQSTLWGPYCVVKVSEGITEAIKQPYSRSKDAIKGNARQDPGLISFASEFLPASLCTRILPQNHLPSVDCAAETPREALPCPWDHRGNTDSKVLLGDACLLSPCLLASLFPHGKHHRIHGAEDTVFFDPTLSPVLWHML